jgi:hypothetical protein
MPLFTSCPATSPRLAGPIAKPTKATLALQVINDLLTGQFSDPVRVMSFKTAEAGRTTSPRTRPAKW